MKNDWPTALRLGAIVLAGFAVTQCARSHKDDPNADQSTMAYVQCKDFVRDRLKSPSSADFSSFPSSNVIRSANSGQHYSVIGSVDAPNSFGANLRSRYICEVEWIGGDIARQSNWTLNNLTIE